MRPVFTLNNPSTVLYPPSLRVNKIVVHLQSARVRCLILFHGASHPRRHRRFEILIWLGFGEVRCSESSSPLRWMPDVITCNLWIGDDFVVFGALEISGSTTLWIYLSCLWPHIRNNWLHFQWSLCPSAKVTWSSLFPLTTWHGCWCAFHVWMISIMNSHLIIILEGNAKCVLWWWYILRKMWLLVWGVILTLNSSGLMVLLIGSMVAHYSHRGSMSFIELTSHFLFPLWDVLHTLLSPWTSVLHIINISLSFSALRRTPHITLTMDICPSHN